MTPNNWEELKKFFMKMKNDYERLLSKNPKNEDDANRYKIKIRDYQGILDKMYLIANGEEWKRYIPISDLVEHGLYKIWARNGRIGYWNSKTEGFTILREKFSNEYLFEEYHWDTGAPFGTTKPYQYLNELRPDTDEDTYKRLHDIIHDGAEIDESGDNYENHHPS